MNLQRQVFVQDALSNSVILRNIFTYLNEQDLESCCNVCENWRSVADPFVLSHFDMELQGYDCSRKNPGRFVIRERCRYNRKRYTESESDFAGVTQELEQVLRNFKVSVNLTLSEGVDMRSDKVTDFLSKFGEKILRLVVQEPFDLEYNMSVVDFCKLLVNGLPYLKILDCSGFYPVISHNEDQDFNPDLPQNKHYHLRKIIFGSNNFKLLSTETILKICPNLEEVEKFPVQLINAVIVAEKGQILKSLYDVDKYRGQFEDNGETVVTAFEKLARMQPKLTSLKFWSDGFDSENTFESVKPSLFSVLQSSHESLESLVISPVTSNDVQHFPALQGLKCLEFLPLETRNAVFFPSEMSFRDKFPNVSKIIIPTVEENHINQVLPEDIISPWRNQISQLKVGHLFTQDIQVVRRLCPSLLKLEMMSSASDVPNIFVELSRCCPQLTSLTFYIDRFHRGDNDNNRWDGKPLRLDHAFTGLPEKVIDQLEDPSRKDDFTQEEIQGFKEQSVICIMQELKELKVILGDYKSLYFTKIIPSYMRLTPVAHEFGFGLLRGLKVIVGIRRTMENGIAIKRDLEPLVRCGNIEIDDGYHAYEW